MMSIIIRTKNEEKWIERCVKAIQFQDYKDFEIIVVDNDSSDKTVDVAKSMGCKIIKISDQKFSYGRALNKGIKESRGDIIVSLSAHCIPLNNKWLESLERNFYDSNIAAVYGRQEPLPDSDPMDKRDLWITFGEEKKVQEKDCFFHNANSAIRRSIWNDFPFNESINGQEDREWAKRIIKAGYKIIYEPLASVHHHHGIHQGRNIERAHRVARIIELIDNNSKEN